MKKIIAALLFASAAGQAFAAPITSASDPALAGATVIDFGASSGTNDFSSSYTFGNATISVATGQLHLSSDSNGEFGITGNSLLNPAGQPIQIDFTVPVSAFGLLRVYAQTPWVMAAFDADGNTIETVNLPGQGDLDPQSFDGISGGLISRVIFTPTPSDAMLIDNLTYVVSRGVQVPEPAMLGLFGMGALGLALARRRR